MGFAASLFAVWCQILLLATISLAPISAAANPLGGVPICHTDNGMAPAQPTPAPPTHDCALCVLCLSHALPLANLSPPSPTLPERRTVATAQTDATQPNAPRVHAVAAAQPRGPPALI